MASAGPSGLGWAWAVPPISLPPVGEGEVKRHLCPPSPLCQLPAGSGQELPVSTCERDSGRAAPRPHRPVGALTSRASGCRAGRGRRGLGGAGVAPPPSCLALAGRGGQRRAEASQCSWAFPAFEVLGTIKRRKSGVIY